MGRHQQDVVTGAEAGIAELEQRLRSSAAENERLQRELALSRDRQKVSAEILRSIAATSGDAEHALQTIAETTQQFFNAASVTLRVAEGDQWVQTVRVGTSAYLTGAQPASQLATRGANLPATVYQENRQIHIPDLDHLDPSMAAWPAKAAREAGIRTICGTPLRRDGKATGALLVYRDRLAPFTDEELALQQTFADQAVIAIENARLFNATKGALDRQDASAEILRTIAAAPTNAEQSLQQIGITTARLFRASSVTLRTVEGDTWGHTIAVGPGSERIASSIRPSDLKIGGKNFPGTIVAENRQIHMPDIFNVEPAYADFPGLVHARAAGTRVMTGTPLRREGQAIGSLIVHRDRSEPFTPEELALQQSFADQAVIAIENARLFNETQAALERQSATAEVLNVIAGSPTDTQPVFEAIAETAVRLLGCDRAFIQRCDGKSFWTVAWCGPEGQMPILNALPVPIDPAANFPSRAIIEKKTLHLPDWSAIELPEFERAIHDRLGISSALYLPLLRNGECIGLLAMAGKRANAFGAADLVLAESFRDQALIAIENARLFNETREALERQTATADILKVIASSPSDVRPVFEAIATSANRLLGGYSTAVFRFIEGMACLEAFTATTPEADEILKSSFPHPLTEFEPFELSQGGKPVQVSDTEDLTHPRIREISRARGFRSMLFAPLMNAGVPIGVISVTRTETGIFADHHVQLLQTFADQAVIAIENTRLFEEVQAKTRDLEESLQQQTATADVLKVISRSAFDLQTVLETLAGSAVELSSARRGTVFLRDGDVFRFRAASHPDLNEDWIRFMKDSPQQAGRHSTVGRAIASARSVCTPDVEADPEITMPTYLAGIRAVLAVPLLRDGKVEGVMALSRQEPGEFTARQIELVETFADQAVIAIENTRLFNETKQALAYQTGSSNVLRVIASSPTDVEPVLKEIVESARELCEANDAVVLLKDAEDLRFSAHSGPIAVTLDKWPISRNWTAGRAFVDQKPVHVHDMLSGEGAEFPDARAMGQSTGATIHTVLSVPLLRGNDSIGAILLRRTEVRPFNDKQINLLSTFADQAVIAIQNARLFNETQEALERQTATAEILKVISASNTDVKPVYDAICSTAARLFDCDLTGVFSIEGASLTAITGAFADRLFEQHEFAPDMPLAADHNFPAMAAVEKRTVYVSDYAASQLPAHEQYISDRYGVRCGLYLPLLRNDECIGIFLLTASKPNHFSGLDIALAELFRDQALIAVENARLFDEVQARTRDLSEALQQQTATADVLKVISRSAFDLQAVLTTLVGSALDLCNAPIGTFFLREGDVLRLASQVGCTPELVQYFHDNPIQLNQSSGAGRAFSTGRVVHFPDVLADPDYRLSEVQRLGDYRSLLAVPLLRGQETIGVFSLSRTRPEPFSQRQIDLVQTFADQAVIAIENTRLFNETREALERQTATADILKIISRSVAHAAPVFDTILESCQRLFNPYDAAVYLVEGDRVRGVARRGPGAGDWGADSMPLEGSSTGVAIAQRQPVHFPDLADKADLPEDKRAVLKETGGMTVLYAPMISRNSGVGSLVVTRRPKKPFTETEIDFIQSFADQAVIAIENARLFNETREALERQTATADILKVIASSPSDAQPVFDAIVASANRLMAGFSSAVFRFAGGMVHLAAFTPVNPAADDALRSTFPRPIDTVPQYEHTLRCEVVHFADAQRLDNPDMIRRLAQARGFGSMIIVPLIHKGEAIGVLNVARREATGFPENHVQLLQTFADQAVIAIENARLFEEVQARTRDLEELLQQQTATADVLKVISRSAFDLDSVMNTLAHSAGELCKTEISALYLREGDVLVARGVADADAAQADFLRATPVDANSSTYIGRTLLAGSIRNIADVWDETEIGVLKQFSVALGFRSILFVPLTREGRGIGVFALARHRIGQFSRREVELIQTFADQAVIAIENARLFDEVQQRTKELAASLDELRTAQDRLVQTEKLASLGQLTAGIAHEIKNPLNFVNNFSALSAELIDEMTEVFENPALDEPNRRKELDEIRELLKSNLEKVVQHGKRADSIVKNMLLHSREGSGEQRAVDINALLDESLNLAYHGARAERPGFNITLQRDFDPVAGTADIYPQEITRVLLNLISNGFYAAGRRAAEAGDGFEPALRAATKNLGDKAEIRIRDNGTGIAPDVKEKIFNPFFTTKPAGEGTGLGLSMSHDIVVKQHGGTIDVDTEPGVFTEFIITLPRTGIVPKTAGGTI